MAPDTAAYLLPLGVLVAVALTPTSTDAGMTYTQVRTLPRCSGVVNQQCRSYGDNEPIVDPCNVPRWVDRHTASTYPCHKH